MPFEQGNTYGKLGGRKGYEYEKDQLDKMIKLLDKFLILTDKIYEGKATKKQAEAFDRLKPIIAKILDKLHASKTDMKVEMDKPILIQTRKYE